MNELVKLNGIEFQKNILVIYEAKKNSSTPSLTPLRQIPVDVSQKSQRQTAFNRTQAVPEHKSFSEVTKSESTKSYNTLIFSDSIPKGIQMYQFNRTLRNRRAKMLKFPGVSSNEILHCIYVHLKGKFIDSVIVHVGVNDLLNGNSQLKRCQLIENIKKITQKCVSFGVKKIYVLVFVFTTKGRFANTRKSSCITFKFLWRKRLCIYQ